jgi:hypothetical protein
MKIQRKILTIFVSAMTGAHMALANTDVLSPQGYGEIRFGMKLSEAEKILMQSAEPAYKGKECAFVEFKKYTGLKFMVEDGVLTRADAAESIKNSADIKVGMPLAAVRKLYPAIVIEAHKYDDQGHYLILNTSNGAAAIVAEEGGGKVTEVRAGLNPSVGYVEGCL